MMQAKIKQLSNNTIKRSSYCKILGSFKSPLSNFARVLSAIAERRELNLQNNCKELKK